MIAWLFPNKLLFRPPAASYKDGPDVIKLQSSDAEQISAKFYENRAAVYTILFSHGNAEDLGTIEPFLLKIRDSGYAVFAYDYHGYGTSSGNPTEENTYRDIDAAYQYLVSTKKISPDRIILHGRSIGGGPAVDIASREHVGGLILESTFTSAGRVLCNFRIFPFDKYENISKMGSITCPVLVIHGKEDRTISYYHGEELFAAASEPKTSLFIDDAGHNNLFNVAGAKYLIAIRYFADGLWQKKDGP